MYTRKLTIEITACSPTERQWIKSIKNTLGNIIQDIDEGGISGGVNYVPGYPRVIYRFNTEKVNWKENGTTE